MPDIIMASNPVYGIAVTSGSFQAACQTYKELVGEIRFLDLILLRLRNGTLRSQRHTSLVLKDTARIWIKIGRELFDTELERQEEEYAERILCEDCFSYFSEGYDRYPTFDEAGGIHAECEDCQDQFEDRAEEDEMEEDEDEEMAISGLFQRDIAKDSFPLLERFGLCTVLRHATANDLADRRKYNLNYERSLLILSVEPIDERGTDWGGKKLFSDDGRYHIAYHSFEVIQLRLPSNADARFRRIVDFGHLVEMDHDPATGPSDRLSPTTRAVQPKWMKWTYAHEEQ